MKLSSKQSTLRQMKADAVAVFISEDKKLFQDELQELRKIFGKRIDSFVELENFKGKNDQVVLFHTEKKIASPRLYIAGLGEQKHLSLEQFRRSAANVSKAAQKANIKHVAFQLFHTQELENGNKFSIQDIASATAEGAYLSLYKFDKYFTEKKDDKKNIQEITIFDSNRTTFRDLQKKLKEVQIICEGTTLTRNLSNAPSNEIYPETLAQAAKQSAERVGYKATIWDKKRIEKEGFGGLLAVNSGSAREPRFIILEHNSNKKLDTIVLIGKGITFDSGGISLKPSNGMSEMKMDMSGAAAVIGTIETAARLKLPIHLVGLIPATENLPSGSAMKPGDIIKHYGGKTSEVDNTDAEGRLILADAIAYASNFKPKIVIDLATLTGACVVALGQHATGMFGNDDELMTKLKKAGEKTFERVWQLPLYDEYEKQIKSDVADVKNIGGKWAGAITAALFLKKFLPEDKELKWVHLDIAGTAILEEALPYSPKGGSGVGVRLLIEFLKNYQ